MRLREQVSPVMLAFMVSQGKFPTTALGSSYPALCSHEPQSARIAAVSDIHKAASASPGNGAAAIPASQPASAKIDDSAVSYATDGEDSGPTCGLFTEEEVLLIQLHMSQNSPA